MRVLSLDFAHRNTGWVVINEDGKLEDFGSFHTRPMKKKNPPKIEWLKYELANSRQNEAAIKDLVVKFRTNKILAEVVYFAQKSTDGILIGMGLTHLHNLGAVLLTGQLVKKLLVGNARASKKDVQTIVRLKAVPVSSDKNMLFVKDDHIIDAYATYMAWKDPRFVLESKIL